MSMVHRPEVDACHVVELDGLSCQPEPTVRHSAAVDVDLNRRCHAVSLIEESHSDVLLGSRGQDQFDWCFRRDAAHEDHAITNLPCRATLATASATDRPPA